MRILALYGKITLLRVQSLEIRGTAYKEGGKIAGLTSAASVPQA